MIRFYADEGCTIPIDTIEWDNKVIKTLFSGEKVSFMNAAMEGDEATANVWVRNEWGAPFYVTAISFHDERVKIAIETDKLFPNKPAKLTLSFSVPKNPTQKDVVKAGQIKIEGYYVYVE